MSEKYPLRNMYEKYPLRNMSEKYCLRNILRNTLINVELLVAFEPRWIKMIHGPMVARQTESNSNDFIQSFYPYMVA